MQAYAGSLTAMLTNPKFHTPIKTLDELLGQNKISWVIEKGTLVEYYMQMAPAGTTMNLLRERAELVPLLTWKESSMYGCYAAKLKGKGTFGSFCELYLIQDMISKDYSSTGKCNFYLVEERLTSSLRGAAFQVNTTLIPIMMLNYFWETFQRESPFLEDFNQLVDFKDQMGLDFFQE